MTDLQGIFQPCRSIPSLPIEQWQALQGPVPQATDEEALQEILGCPQGMQLLYGSLCTNHRPGTTSRETPVDAVTYLKGLVAGAELQKLSVKTATMKLRDNSFQERASWLQEHTGYRDVMSCTPEDLIVYLTTHWLSVHAGCSSSKDGMKYGLLHLSPASILLLPTTTVLLYQQ